MEKAHEKQVPLSYDDWKSLRDNRSFWTTDYPLISYYKSGNKQIVMTHLADSDAPSKNIMLKNNEEFLAFVDKFSQSSNASVSFILKSKEENSEQDSNNKSTDQFTINYLIRTVKYRKPYEKKDFTDDAYW